MKRIKPYIKRIGHYMKRFSVLFLVTFFIMALAFWQWTSGEFLAAFVLMWGIPISRIFMLGSLRNRLVNGLSFIVLYVYLILGVRFGLWDEASYLLMATPYISMAIKPNRSWIKYLTVALTTAYLIFGVVTGNQVPWYVKVPSIVFVYIIFFPAIVKSTFEKSKQRITRRLSANNE